MSNFEAKNAIIRSIRGHLAASKPFDELHKAHHANGGAEPATRVTREFSKNDLIENFRASLEFVGAHLLLARDEAQAAEVLAALIEEKTARKIAFSDSPLVKKIVQLLNADAELLENAAPEVLFETDLGVTGAQWAIAETGTLVLEMDSERHRLTSLVPPIHVCVLEARQIRQSLGEILTLLQKNLSRTITFVTGASRTSDIELTLAVGVHGPGELHVILIDRDE